MSRPSQRLLQLLPGRDMASGSVLAAPLFLKPLSVQGVEQER